VIGETWWEDAACAGMDTDIFFPPKGSTAPEAKATCGRCSVVAECRSATDRIERWGINPSDLHGVFGGETVAERVKRRRAEKAVAA